MQILKGADTSERLKNEAAALLEKMGGYIPKLAIVRVGENPADISYEKGAAKKMAAFGMTSQVYAFDSDIPAADFIKALSGINRDPSVDGILLLRPLPAGIDMAAVEEVMDTDKDLDCMTEKNLVRVFTGVRGAFAPCTAEAVMEILHTAGISLSGKNVTIVGRSLVVGKPLSMLALAENATVTICHSRTKDLAAACLGADILVAAVGKPGMIGKDHIREGAVVVDVGINMGADGRLCGDVCWQAALEKASAATPVPGGVGTVTTAVLAKHLAVSAAKRHFI